MKSGGLLNRGRGVPLAASPPDIAVADVDASPRKATAAALLGEAGEAATLPALTEVPLAAAGTAVLSTMTAAIGICVARSYGAVSDIECLRTMGITSLLLSECPHRETLTSVMASYRYTPSTPYTVQLTQILG